MRCQFRLKTLIILCLATFLTPAIAAEESRPDALWFNQYAMPDHCDEKLLDQDYPLRKVFTRFYSYLSVAPEQAIPYTQVCLNWEVNPKTGSLIYKSLANDIPDKQVLASFLDASLLAGPVKIGQKYQKWFDDTAGKAGFYFELQPKLKSSLKGAQLIKDIKTKLDSNQQEKILLPAIPRQLQDLFPNLFSENELDSSFNYRAIDSASVDLKTFEQMREPWQQLFCSGRTPSRDEVLSLRDRVDTKYAAIIQPLNLAQR